MNAKKFFLVMVAMVILSIGAAFGAIYYGDKFLSVKSQDLARSIAERDAQTDVISRIKSSASTSKNLDDLRTLVGQVLPNEKRQGDLVADFLYTASTQAGIPTGNITNISFSSGATPDTLSGAVKSKAISDVYEYPFTIQMKDIPYNKLLGFFTELEKNKRIISIDNLQLTPNSKDPNILNSVTLSLKTYIKP